MTFLKRSNVFIFYWLAGALFIIAGCSSTEPLSDEEFAESDKSAKEITAEIPNYRQDLTSLSGSGRAVVSEPENTERVRLNFSSNRQKSLVTVKSGVGIEGGQMLTDGDSLLVYNKVDNYARHISVEDDELSNLDNLASLNILDIISFNVDQQEVESVQENKSHFKLELTSGTQLWVDQSNHSITRIQQPENSDLPYSRIDFQNFDTLEGYLLPRRITIYSADQRSKVDFLVQSLEINPELESLAIDLPDDIKIYNR